MEEPHKKALRLILVYTGSSQRPDILMRITHDDALEREEWRMFRRLLSIQMDEMHASALPSLVERVVVSPPCVIGRFADGEHTVILHSNMIEECDGDPDLLMNALWAYACTFNVDLGFPRSF
ncbi:MAG TPA: hypothetical protein VN397_04555 [Candidatus Methylomirabilis sp.]|nr:hypothetical protein [Candidatus Methylomirabilis sp.]